MSWRRGPAVPKPAAGGFDMPKVRPAEGLMPGLLKLKPELLLLPKPRKARERGHRRTPYKKEMLEKTKGNVNMKCRFCPSGEKPHILQCVLARLPANIEKA